MSRALCLSGGAARGAVQVKVIQHLMSTYDYDAVYGVSVGSVNGVMAVTGQLQEMEAVWRDLDGLRGFMKFDPSMRNAGAFNMEPLRHKLRDYARLELVQVPFYVGITSLQTGQYFNYAHSDMKYDSQLVSAVLGSASMPMIMHAQSVPVPRPKRRGYRRQLCVDGGVRNTVPALESVFDEVHVALCSPLEPHLRVQRSWQPEGILQRPRQVLGRVFEIMRADTLEADLKLLQACSRSPLKVWAPNRMDSGLLDADPDTIRALIELGQETVARGPVLIGG